MPYTQLETSVAQYWTAQRAKRSSFKAPKRVAQWVYSDFSGQCQGIAITAGLPRFAPACYSQSLESRCDQNKKIH
jgi:hypothetical protein